MSVGRRQGLDGDRDLLVIGGGVMGLFTAYHASQRFGRVVVLERGRIGDPMTASFGRTRSFRNDYLDATYARLAHEAFRLWGAFELQTATRALVRCGCLNIAKRSVTPELADTYAQMSHETLTRLGLRTESFDGAALRDRFDLDADMGRLDVDAGVVDLPAVTAALTRALAERGVQVVQEVETLAIERDRAAIRVTTDAGDFVTRSLVVTAGHGTNEVLAKLPDCALQVPITKDRPSEAKYFVPPGRGARSLHGGGDAGDRLPGHRHLLPSDRRRARRRREDRLLQPARHAAQHHGDRQHPELRRAAACPGCATPRSATSRTSTSATTTSSPTTTSCSGPIPGLANAFVGVGWRGTGYKFAPWVGRVLAELALQGGTVYDIARFDPARFEQGKTNDDPSVAQDPAAASR